MNKLEIILTTFPSIESAENFARKLIERRLAACVNIVDNIKSYFHWQGSISKEAEILLIIKSSPELRSQLQSFFTANHPYEVFEFICMDLKYVTDQYLSWAKSNLNEDND